MVKILENSEMVGFPPLGDLTRNDPASTANERKEHTAEKYIQLLTTLCLTVLASLLLRPKSAKFSENSNLNS